MATNTEFHFPKKWTVPEIGRILQMHMISSQVQDEKIAAVYEKVVTGNGELPLCEQVRNHSDWIRGFNVFVKVVIIPLGIALTLSVIGFIWGLITHIIVIQ
jgi:hypothetical protein